MRICDPEIGMNGFIAVHSTLRGPSLGGLRIRNYPSEEHALQDVMKLAEAMTYKAAAAAQPFGGGRQSYLAKPNTQDASTAAALRKGRGIAEWRICDGRVRRQDGGRLSGSSAVDEMGRWPTEGARVTDVDEATAGIAHTTAQVLQGGGNNGYHDIRGPRWTLLAASSSTCSALAQQRGTDTRLYITRGRARAWRLES